MANYSTLVDRYEYLPLPAEGWIRVLELHPGSGPLSCTLRCIRIKDAALNFEALSYVWGSDAHTNKFDIHCNGRTLSIGSNLKCALSHVRHQTRPRLLWVDAVCINQKDSDEKSQQVKRMGEIYVSAERVLMWIGEDKAGEAEACFALIQDTNTVLMDLLLRYKDVANIPLIQHGNGSICSDSQQWDMVRRLMDSEWFTRVWVLQEVGLARSAMIIWGKAHMNWSQLVEFMLFVASRVDVGVHTGNVRSGTIWDVYEDVWRSFENNETWRNELPLTASLNHTVDGQTLIDVLNDGRMYHATDQRDRIYAFLSHPKASSYARKKAAVIGYHKSVDEVYTETASYILENDHHPWTVLSCVDHTPDLPSLSGRRRSWVPRWDEGFRVYWLGYPSMWYRAGGDQPVAFQVKVASDSSLDIQTILLDTIAWKSQAFTSDELDLAHQKQGAPLQELWRELQQSDQSTVYSPSSDNREYVYSLVIAAGRAADEGPAEDNPSLHRSVYQAYKDMIGGSKEAEDTSLIEGARSVDEHSERLLQVEALTYINNQHRALHNRRLFRTQRSYYGVGHRTLEVGDVCCVFKGANVPFVLRRAECNEQNQSPSNQYKLVGEAYIQGIMKGEVLEILRDKRTNHDITERNIMII